MKNAVGFLVQLALIVAIGFEPRSQNPAYINYSSRDVLPSNEVYEVIQSRDGTMYFSMESGIVMYDSKRFQSLPSPLQNTRSKSCFKLREGKEGMAAILYRNRLCHLRNGHFTVSVFDSALSALLGWEYINELEVDSADNIYVVSTDVNENSFVASPDGTIKPLACHEAHGDLPVFQLHRIPGTSGWISQRCFPGRDDLVRRRSSKINKPLFEQTNTGWMIYVDEVYGNDESMTELTRVAQCGPYLGFGSGLHFAVKNLDTGEERLFEVEQRINSVDTLVGGALVVGTNNGLYAYYPGSQQLEFLFDGFTVTDCAVDAEGAIWLTTLNKGILYIPCWSLRTIGKPLPDMIGIRRIESNQQWLAVNSLDHGIFLIEHAGNGWQGANLTIDGPEIPGPWREDILLLENDTLVAGPIKYDLKSHTTSLENWDPVNLAPYYSDRFWVSKGGTFQCMAGRISLKHLLGDRRATASERTPLEKKLLLGTTAGVSIYDLEFRQLIHNQIAELEGVYIRKIRRIGPESFVIASDRGLYYRNGAISRLLQTKDGLISNHCTSLEVESDSVFWVGSNKGVDRVSVHKGGFEIRHLGASLGLISPAVKDLTFRNDTLYVATEGRISYFNSKNLNLEIMEPELKVTSIHINHIDHGLEEPIQILPKQRNMSIRFSAQTFRAGMNMKYQYRLLGLDDEWMDTEEGVATFYDLPPGEFTFEARSKRGINPWQATAIRFPVSVSRKLTEYALFWIAIATLVLLLTSGLFYWYFRNVEQQRQLKWSYSNAQLKALGLQMNPHFFFNVLNNVQSLSYLGDHESVNLFIEKLSNLTRRLLDHSFTPVISLRSELENLREYLDIEHLRFKDKPFTSNIRIDTGIDQDQFMVPPMLLQPLVENALWHGLLQKNEDRCLEIAGQVKGRDILISVRDNGNGLSSTSTRPGKPSISLSNIQKRIDLYNKLELGTCKFEIDFNANDTFSSQGTRATLTFHQILSKDA